jgi:mannonate dehydratase
MRNIRGGLHDFVETYPDEGDMDFSKLMRVLRDGQYAYSICADHALNHPDDPGKLQAFAFQNGYLKGLIDTVNSEVDG